ECYGLHATGDLTGAQLTQTSFGGCSAARPGAPPSWSRGAVLDGCPAMSTGVDPNWSGGRITGGLAWSDVYGARASGLDVLDNCGLTASGLYVVGAAGTLDPTAYGTQAAGAHCWGGARCRFETSNIIGASSTSGIVA